MPPLPATAIFSKPFGALALGWTALVALVAASSGCATAPKTASNPAPELRFAINYLLDPRSKTDWASSIDVYRGTRRLQNLELPLESCDLEKSTIQNGRDPLSEKDFNFDGVMDLFLRASSSTDDGAIGCVWLFNPASDRFEYSDALSSLTSLEVEPKRKWILSYEGSAGKRSGAEAAVYAWNGAALKLLYAMKQSKRTPKGGTTHREVIRYSGPRSTLQCQADLTPQGAVHYSRGNAESCLLNLWPLR